MAKKKKIKLSFEIDGLENSVKNIEDLENNLSLLNEELKTAEIGSDNFKELSKAISETDSQLKDLSLSFEGLDASGKASEFGSFAAGMADTATGALALSGAFGLTNDSSMKMVESLASGMAVAQSFRGGIEGIISAQKLLRSSTIAQTVATKGGAVAQGILNAVMAANPIFLLVAAIAALVAGLAIFTSSSNDAKEKSEQLNNTLEDQKRAYDNLSDSLDRMDAKRQRELDTHAKILSSELSLLKSKKNLTKGELERIEEIENELGKVTIDKLESTLDSAQEKFLRTTDLFGKTFEKMYSDIDATRTADWGPDDLDYEGLKSKNLELSRSFEAMRMSGLTPTNVEDQLETIDKLEKELSDFVVQMERDAKKLGSSSKEIFDGGIESANGMVQMYKDLRNEAITYRDTLDDLDTNSVLESHVDVAKDITKENENIITAERARERYLQNELKIKEQLLKIDQSLELASIDQSDLEGQLEAETLKREQQLENELRGIEGNSEKANELRKRLTELANQEILSIQDNFNKQIEEREQLKRDTAEQEGIEAINKIMEGERMLADAKVMAMEEGYEKEKAFEEIRYQEDLLRLQMALDEGLLTEEMYLESVQLATTQHNNEMNRLYQEDVDNQNASLQVKKDMAMEATEGLLTGIADLTQAFAGESEAAQKKAFKVNKAFQIAQATIDTIKGGVSAFTGMVAAVPGPVGIVLGAVAAAGVVASGVASIKKIAATKFMGSGGGGGSAPSIRSESPKSAPQPPSINLYGNENEGSEGTNEQGYGNRQSNNQPQRVYVLESDITDTQRRVNSYQERSEIIGG